MITLGHTRAEHSPRTKDICMFKNGGKLFISLFYIMGIEV